MRFTASRMQSNRFAGSVEGVLGDHCVEAYVPAVRHQAVDALHLESDAEQVGSIGLRSVPREREGAVVEAATHAESMALAVETDKRYEHEIESSRGDV